MATAISPGRRMVPKSAPPTHGHRIAAAHARQDEGEDEKEEQRLHPHAQHKRQKFAREHAQIAQKQPAKGLEEDAASREIDRDCLKSGSPDLRQSFQISRNISRSALGISRFSHECYSRRSLPVS